jgi:hypothetical protein
MNNTNTRKCNHVSLLYKLVVPISIVNHLLIVVVVVLVIVVAIAIVDPE